MIYLNTTPSQKPYLLKLNFLLLLFSLFCTSCSSQRENTDNPEPEVMAQQLSYLALGDSYTIGESVAEEGRWPIQLRDRLVPDSIFVDVDIIATTGWTTTNLISALDEAKPDTTYDLVSLLIGVNNQFQNKPFALYQNEFQQLLDRAISYAGSDKDRVFVVSIPDYAFTPFGQSTNAERISRELDDYNAYAKQVTDSLNIAYVNITDITRRGIEEPALVASDNLHPSALAYSEFVDRIYPIIIDWFK